MTMMITYFTVHLLLQPHMQLCDDVWSYIRMNTIFKITPGKNLCTTLHPGLGMRGSLPPLYLYLYQIIKAAAMQWSRILYPIQVDSILLD